MVFFDDSRPERRKRANRGHEAREARAAALVNSPIPPAKPAVFMTLDELYWGGYRTLIYDVESFPNYFLVSFKCVETGKIVYFEDSPEAVVDTQLLAFVMLRNRVVGFNSDDYDRVMVELAIQGRHAEELHEFSNRLIVGGERPFDIRKETRCRLDGTNQIDLIEVAPLDASLKIYGGRLHCQRMQELPYPVGSYLSQEQAFNVRSYNFNDLDETEALFNFLSPQIELREEIGREYYLDLRSKSDAQIAETVIHKELEKIGVKPKRPAIEPGKVLKYNPPPYIKFRTPQLQRVFEQVCRADYVIDANGYVDLPPQVGELDIRIGRSVYRMGMGGLHSTEKSTGYQSDDHFVLIDRDVESFYPNMILNQGLYPEQLGHGFLEVFRDLVKRRMFHKIEAKKYEKLGDKAQEAFHKIKSDALKITINGTFGKLGSPHSILYAPQFLIQTTLTGQLLLLMAIEMVELCQMSVVSANTDGFVTQVPRARRQEFETALIMWEEETGLKTEEAVYKSLWSRDVNNYIAVKEDGKTKMKGVYSEVGSAQNSPLSKNPENFIVSMAVQQLLSKGVPIAETILNRGYGVETKYYPTEVSRFVSVRNVKGGAEKNGVYLGRAVRWYYAKDVEGEINYVISGNKVPKTEGAKPLMDLPDTLPNDIDFDRYIAEAEEALYDIGYYRRETTKSLF